MSTHRRQLTMGRPPAVTHRVGVARTRREQRRRLRTAALVTTAVTATAVVGSLGSTTDTAWFRALDKPRWYPHPKVFPIAWTALYASIAWASTRALNESSGRERADVVRALGPNLALNAGWTWAFFRAQRPDLALAAVLALDASNLVLVRRVGRQDAAAGVALLPYVAWTGFATALTEEIWYRN